jgi:hypothetical protein
MSMASIDAQTLQAALIGYQHEHSVILQRIAEIQSQLRGAGAGKSTGEKMAGGRKRVMSAAARKRIAAAQRKRWAAYHDSTGGKPAAKKTGSKKRRLSPEGRARIAEAARKRWAAARANKVQTA